MNRTVKILTLSSILLAMPALAKSAYTRDDAIRVALENSPDIKTAEQTLQSAESQVTAAYGNALPVIDLSATYARTFGVDDIDNDATPISDMLDNTADMNDRIMAGALDKISNGMAAMGGYRWGTQVGITATQILYAQGKVSTGTKIAKSYKRVSELNLETAKQDVRYNVEIAFDQLIYLDSTIVILQSTIDQLQENLDYVTQAVKSGLATELDLIRVQISMDELQTNLQKTQKNRIVARNALLNTMGLPWDAEAEFNGDLRDPKNGFQAPDTVMANVRQRRKELAQLTESAKMYEDNIDIEEGGYKPTLILGGSITYQDGQNNFAKWSSPKWDKNIAKKIYLNFSMNLFNGMQTREKVVQAKTDLRKTQIQKETAERGIQLEMESAKNTLEDAQNQIEIQQRRIDLAQKNLDMTEAAYKAGRETQLNFLDANMSLKNARLDYLSAIVDWNKAYNAMLKATGEY